MLHVFGHVLVNFVTLRDRLILRSETKTMRFASKCCIRLTLDENCEDERPPASAEVGVIESGIDGC